MFRNIGRKENFKEITKFGGNHTKIMWNKQAVIVDDYQVDDDGNIVVDENDNPIIIGHHEDPNLVSWMEENFISSTPDIQQIKKMILDQINTETDIKILNGFSWTSPDDTVIPVYLSSENQFNYKAAYDLAYQTNGASLPFTLKFGESDAPQYYEFNTLETFNNFYVASINFINTTLQEGWEKKDSIDWDKYIVTE